MSDGEQNDVSGIFEGLGERRNGKGETDEAGVPRANPTGADPAQPREDVVDIFDTSTSPDTIPYRGDDRSTGVVSADKVPMAMPVATPVATKRKVAAEPSGAHKQRLPSVEELTALADDAFENYNFIESARLIQKAVALDASFSPARELFVRLYREHPHLFDEEGAWKNAFSNMRSPDIYDEGAHQDVTLHPRHSPGPRSASGATDPVIEARNIGEKGLVKTRSGRVEQKVYATPKMMAETISTEDKKGYRDTKKDVSKRGTVAGLLMGVVALAIISFALWWTGMLEF